MRSDTRLVPRKGEPPPDARQALTQCLDGGQTGGLTGETRAGARVEVYVMMGEVLAARSSADDDECLRLLGNAGYVTPARSAELAGEARSGGSLSVLLFDLLPEAVLTSLYFERFRQNLYDFLGIRSTVLFEPMEAVFVENIQVGHDSRELVAELIALREELTGLELDPDQVIGAGAGAVSSAEQVRFVELCAVPLPLAELVARSPFERSRTLAQLAAMLVTGTLETGGAEAPRPTPRRPVQAPTVADPAPEPTGSWVSGREDLATETGGQDLLGEADLEEHTEEVLRPLPAVSPKAPPRIEERRVTPVPDIAPARTPASFVPAPVDQDDLAAFADHDTDRGDGSFVARPENLDRVSLDHEADITELPAPKPARRPSRREPVAVPPPLAASPDTVLEMEEADPAVVHGAVSLNFSGPKLLDDDARHKLEVVNEVLATVADALDDAEGGGVGTARVQLLVESTSGPPAAIFAHVEVLPGGRLPIDHVLRNLRKRPVGEHRRLLNRGLSDLIERALSLANETLDNRGMERMLERIAGYQSRMGI